MSENLYGYQDDQSKDLEVKAKGVFGLNQNVYLKNFEYNSNAGKDGAESNAIDVCITVEEKEFRTRFYEITKAFTKDGAEITDRNDPIFQAFFKKEMPQINGVMTHILKCFVTEQQLKTALQGVSDFASWATALQNVLPQNYSEKPLDIFLQYQWNIKGDNDRTYLEMPKNMKDGYFICPAQAGIFEEKRTKEGDLYYENEQGVKHLFEKSSNFMSNKKGYQQFEGTDEINTALSATQSEANDEDWTV